MLGKTFNFFISQQNLGWLSKSKISNRVGCSQRIKTGLYVSKNIHK